MLPFAWRWAKVGDNVLIHDRDNLDRELIQGIIEVVKRVDQQTSLGVRIVENGVARFVWPTPLFIHPSPEDPDESCWICEENASVELGGSRARS